MICLLFIVLSATMSWCLKKTETVTWSHTLTSFKESEFWWPKQLGFCDLVLISRQGPNPATGGCTSQCTLNRQFQTCIKMEELFQEGQIKYADQ